MFIFIYQTIYQCLITIVDKNTLMKIHRNMILLVNVKTCITYCNLVSTTFKLSNWLHPLQLSLSIWFTSKNQYERMRKNQEHTLEHSNKRTHISTNPVNKPELWAPNIWTCSSFWSMGIFFVPSVMCTCNMANLQV